MVYLYINKLAAILVGLGLLGSVAQAQSLTTSVSGSSTADFAPGVTPPPNQPLPPLNCPKPTQRYCYWEPDIDKDKYYTCWRSWLLYTSSSYSVLWSSTRRWTKTHTLNSTTSIHYSTTWDPDVSFSTLCDGHARAPTDASPILITSTATVPLTTPRVSLEIDPESDYLPWPTPPPCRIPDDPCASLSHAYESMSVSFWGGWYSTQIPLGLWHPPPCSVDYTSYYPQSTCAPPASRLSCSIFPGELTMLYWPVTTASGNVCGQNGSVVTGTPTIPGRPNTAEYEGETLTSPSVYMIVGTARALQIVNQTHTSSGWCAPTAHSLTMTMNPTDVSKKIWHNGNQLQTLSFNFNDLNTIPYSVYTDEVCRWGTFRNMANDDCKTVWGGYTPTVLVPASVTEEVRSWESCDVVQMAQVEKWIPLGPVPEAPNKVRAGTQVPNTAVAVPTGS